MGKMRDPETKKKAIELLAAGKTLEVVGAELSVDKSTLSRFQNKDANREKIVEAAQKYINAIPSIVDHDIAEINDYFKISQKLRDSLNAKEDKNLKNTKALQDYCVYIDKRLSDIKRSLTLYSSQHPALVFQQLNVFNTQTNELAPIISKLLGSVQNNAGDEDIIDVEAVDNEGCAK